MSTTFLNSITKVLNRDLDLLEKEINLYSNEEKLWTLKGEIKNTAGNLCMHLCGNLQHFVGTTLGKTDYKRNREFEFSGKNVPRNELLVEIQKTKETINQVVPNLVQSDLDKDYPIQVFANQTVSTQLFLIHLAGHLNYHLGQINYHRRILDAS